VNAVKLGRSINLKHPILDDGRNRDDDANRLRPMISQTNLKRFTTLRIVPRKRLATNGWSNLVTVSRGRKMAGRKWLTKYGCGCPRLALADIANRGRHGRRGKITDEAGHKGLATRLAGRKCLATNGWPRMTGHKCWLQMPATNGWTQMAGLILFTVCHVSIAASRLRPDSRL